MLTKDLIKTEIDRVQDEYLEVLYRIIKALEHPVDSGRSTTWREFVTQTYGCLSNTPIDRGDQGGYERRDALL